ncbi:hypothetical protein GF376_01070 [Candidatus Peregrinibacteria bacterium]|nr:hypothetical protein [Candidatus Peregrinibacteria bacterium]
MERVRSCENEKDYTWIVVVAMKNKNFNNSLKELYRIVANDEKADDLPKPFMNIVTGYLEKLSDLTNYLDDFYVNTDIQYWDQEFLSVIREQFFQRVLDNEDSEEYNQYYEILTEFVDNLRDYHYQVSTNKILENVVVDEAFNNVIASKVIALFLLIAAMERSGYDSCKISFTNEELELLDLCLDYCEASEIIVDKYGARLHFDELQYFDRFDDCQVPYVRMQVDEESDFEDVSKEIKEIRALLVNFKCNLGSLNYQA